MHATRTNWMRSAGWYGLALLGWFAAQDQLALHAQQQPSKPPAKAAASDADQGVVAYVNGVPITRQELAEELLARKGKQQLELLINRKIIEQAAQKAGVSVTDAEIDADIKDVMQAAGCTTIKEFENKVLKDRDSTILEYREDVVKPALLMKKIGGQRVAVTEEDLKKAFDAKYGEKVQCRVILEKQRNIAQKVYGEIIAAKPQGNESEREALARAFLNRAKMQSDTNFAFTAGKIDPIGRGTTYEAVEKSIFALQDGELSQVIQVPEGYLIVLREKLVPPDPNVKLADVRETLRAEVSDCKLKIEVPKLFKEIREGAVVRDYLNNRYDIKQVLEELMNKTAAARARV